MEDFYLTWEKTNFALLTVLCIGAGAGHGRGSALVQWKGMCKAHRWRGERGGVSEWEGASNTLYVTRTAGNTAAETAGQRRPGRR